MQSFQQAAALGGSQGPTRRRSDEFRARSRTAGADEESTGNVGLSAARPIC